MNKMGEITDLGLLTHNSIIHRTKKRLEDKFQMVEIGLEYYKIGDIIQNDLAGEIDLICYRPNTLFLFEMKSTFTEKAYQKANIQLNRAQKILVPQLIKDGLNIQKTIPIFISRHPNRKKQLYFHNINLPPKYEFIDPVAAKSLYDK